METTKKYLWKNLPVLWLSEGKLTDGPTSRFAACLCKLRAKQLKHEVGKLPMYTELSNLAGGGGSPVMTDTSMQGLSYPSLHCDQINLISRCRNS